MTDRAHASVARALSLGELVQLSQHTLVGTPVDLFGKWETIGRRSRIVTYTLVRTEASLDGRAPDTSEVMVRTLGGRVGDIGQAVPGEAMLEMNKPATVFLVSVARDVFAVTGMAQGNYPLTTDGKGVTRLHAATELLELMGGATDANAAVKRLDGRTVPEVEVLVHQELTRGTR